MIVLLVHVCGSRGPGWAVLGERCAKLQKGLPDGQGGEELPPPGQIGRMKLFEAGRHRLTGMADGLGCVCVTQSGEAVNWLPDSRNA